MVPPRGSCFSGCGEHEADVAALEEGEVARIEKELHAEGVLVEVLGAGEVIDGDGDLGDRIEMDGGGYASLDDSSGSSI